VGGLIGIALCDDCAEDIRKLVELEEQFSREHAEYPLQLTTFASPMELTKFLDKNGGFDLYILDVVMPEITGIELAEKIRRRGERAEILFLTCSREYAVDAFSVHASGYLLKPVCKESFDEELLRVLKKLSQNENAAITVRTKNGMRRIDLRELVMIESFNHTRALTFADGSVLESAVTLSELSRRLSGHDNFYIPHRAYIINLDHLTGITRYELIMTGDRHIPIPRKQFNTVREVFFRYFFKD